VWRLANYFCPRSYKEPLRNNIAISTDFVTDPYAAQGAKVAMLFFFSGLAVEVVGCFGANTPNVVFVVANGPQGACQYVSICFPLFRVCFNVFAAAFCVNSAMKLTCCIYSELPFGMILV
jgi:hypothetical protein